MNIILDNIIFCLQKAGGISVYWYELLRRLVKTNENVYFIGNRANNNIFYEKLSFEMKNAARDHPLPVIISRYLPIMSYLTPQAIFHSSYYRIARQKNVVNVVTVHDFTYEYFRQGIRKNLHSWQKKIAIKNADGIICISENTKNDLIKFHPTVDRSKIAVIYNGISEEFFFDKCLTSLVELDNGKRIILFIGDRMPYKNFKIAVQVVSTLKDYQLVLVSGDKLASEEKAYLNLNLGDRFYHYQSLETSKLNKLYNIAFCLLYPSSYEGFGIPVGEAMQAGCPVVTTKRSSIPEVCGEAGIMVDNIEVDDFIRAIQKIEDDTYRKKLIEKGFEQAKEFSWDKCVNQTLAFYRRTYQRKFQ